MKIFNGIIFIQALCAIDQVLHKFITDANVFFAKSYTPSYITQTSAWRQCHHK